MAMQLKIYQSPKNAKILSLQNYDHSCYRTRVSLPLSVHTLTLAENGITDLNEVSNVPYPLSTTIIPLNIQRSEFENK